MHISACLIPNESVDDKTIGFQGSHEDKQKNKLKMEGYDLMVECWCDNYFTYSFHFRNMYKPIKYLRLKLSPLRSLVLGLIDTLPHLSYITSSPMLNVARINMSLTEQGKSVAILGLSCL